ncbi:hypothetical protein ACFQY7_49810 [Actinomadura luteofluorescens]|uniref:hypothetical protein n=1 Tax=Actinomadura luteofluorescens TaxID=46163 RepID=UPI00363A5EA5
MGQQRGQHPPVHDRGALPEPVRDPLADLLQVAASRSPYSGSGNLTRDEGAGSSGSTATNPRTRTRRGTTLRISFTAAPMPVSPPGNGRPMVVSAPLLVQA